MEEAAPRRQIDYPYPHPTGLDYNCTYTYSDQQMMPGINCKTKNNNSARGNVFALPYNPELPFNRFPRRYVTPKISTPSLKIVNERTQFYPYQTWFNRKNPWYLTYPEHSQYTSKGKPYYTENFTQSSNNYRFLLSISLGVLISYLIL